MNELQNPYVLFCKDTGCPYNGCWCLEGNMPKCELAPIVYNSSPMGSLLYITYSILDKIMTETRRI